MILNGRPGDERGFIHKKIFGGIKGAIGSVVTGITRGQLPTPISLARGAAGGFFRGGSRPPIFPGTSVPVSAVIPTSQIIPGIPDVIDTIRDIFDGNGNGGPLEIGGGATNGCADPRLERNEQGFCEFPGSPAGGVGELRKGKFGPAEEPMFVTRNVRFCLDGMILGKDKLCYTKGSITNKERLYPKGAAPLLTGGDMSAIRKAAAAGGRLKRAQKRLEAIGLIKKPATRRAAGPKQPALIRIQESGKGGVQVA